MNLRNWWIRRNWLKLITACAILIPLHMTVAGSVAANPEQSAAEQDEQIPLMKVIELGGEYARYTNDYGTANSQFARITITKPYKYMWNIETGRAERFQDEGFGFGVSYTRYLPDGFSFLIGASTGTGDYIFPEHRLDLAIGRAFLEKDNLLATLGYTRTQSKAENRSYGVGLEFTWYVSDHWILGATGRYEVGHPGRTESTSGGFGITYNIYRKFYLGAAVEFGNISYILVQPSRALVDYERTAYKLYSTYYVTPSAGFNLRLDYEDNEYYEARGGSLSIFKEW